MRRYRSKSRRASSLLPRKSPAGCGAGSLAVVASSTAPLRRKHDPVVALDRGPGLRATSAAASAGSRSAGSPMPPPGRCGARRSSLVARGRRQIGVARKWRRNGLKRLNPRPEMVWARKPRTHKMWYQVVRLTVRDCGRGRCGFRMVRARKVGRFRTAALSERGYNSPAPDFARLAKVAKVAKLQSCRKRRTR